MDKQRTPALVARQTSLLTASLLQSTASPTAVSATTPKLDPSGIGNGISESAITTTSNAYTNGSPGMGTYVARSSAAEAIPRALARVKAAHFGSSSMHIGPGSAAASPSGVSSGVQSVEDADRQVLAYFGDPDIDLKEEEFAESMWANGMQLVRVPGDGACLYASVGAFLNLDPATVHAATMAFVAKQADFFAPFLTEPIDRYLARKRQLRGGDGAFGNHVELLAIACHFGVMIHVHETDWSTNCIDPTECPIFQSQLGDQLVDVHVWHHGGHYDALVPVNQTEWSD
ncbi:hypothetical protein BC828DRAFT_412514 [Blastocladiella britannica]|nr:hypothetical protein BC828DRAFT_412514 [Blastocladiella britannica]